MLIAIVLGNQRVIKAGAAFIEILRASSCSKMLRDDSLGIPEVYRELHMTLNTLGNDQKYQVFHK